MKSMLRPLVLLMSLSAAHLTVADNLETIYQEALTSDPVLRAAQARYRAGQESAVLGRAALLPQINASASLTQSDSERSSYTSLGAVPAQQQTETDTDTTQYSISLNQALFDLGAWYNYRAGQELSAQSSAQLMADEQTLIVRVAEAYFNVLRAQDNLASARAEERAIGRQLEQTQQRFEVGLIAITDVHEAQAAADLALAQRLTEEDNLGIAREALRVLTGQNHEAIWRLSEDFPIRAPEPTDRNAWVDVTLANSPALKASQLGSEASRRQAQAARAGHYPTVSGHLSYTDEDTRGDLDYSNAFASGRSPADSDQQTTAITLSVQVPLFSGMGTSAKRRQAHEQYLAAQEQFYALQRNTVQAVRSLHLSVTTDVARVNARRQSIISNQSALEATQAGYEVGTRNVVDVLLAQRNLYQALRDYANSRYDYVINTLKLKQQAGILTPEDITQLNRWLIPADLDETSAS